MTISFGTDGWRAVISEDFTFDNVRIVAQAIAGQTIADVASTADGRRPCMVVGFDTRFLSDRYAIAVAEVLAGNGIDVWLSQADAPTPMISYAIVDKEADGGVMITASHNPPRYNGIKLKAAYGGSAGTTTVRQVEQRIHAQQAEGVTPQQMPYAQAIQEGRIQRFNPLPAYEAHLNRLVDFDRIRNAHLSVAIDAMYGAGRVYMRRLFEDHGCQVLELRGEMNPGFNGIHPEPIARHLRPLIDAMATGRYSIGLATDGDADRIGAIDPSGRFIDPHGIMALLVDYLVHERGLRGSIIKTVSTTQLLNRLALRYNLPLQETPVGFNYICDLILQSQSAAGDPVLLGGEESGGITIHGHIPEGDGILMGLLLAELTATRNKTLAQLLDELMSAEDIGTFRYARLDQPVRPFRKADLVAALLTGAPSALAGTAVRDISDQDGVKFFLEDNSWLLIRPSGTEPVLRIYAESHSDQQVQMLLDDGATLAEQILNRLVPVVGV